MRFLLASLFALAFVFKISDRKAWRSYIRPSFIPAMFLVLTLVFQTWGLRYTTATKSGFITTLYVIFVPMLESILGGRRLSIWMWFCVITALFGMGMLVNGGIEQLNFGDFLTLICAFAAAGQIYWLGMVSPGIKRPFMFNLNQAVWGAILCSPVLIFEPTFEKFMLIEMWPKEVWWGLGSLTIGSTLIAFYLQLRAQAYLSATVSSLLFLLESPFALLFATLILGETLGLIESLGAALIFVSAVAASLLDSRRRIA